MEPSFPVGRTGVAAPQSIRARGPRLPLAIAVLVALGSALGAANAQDAPRPGFYYGGLLGTSHDSNVFRTSAANGKRSDWINTYGLLGGYDRTFSRTRLYANATVSRIDFRDLSDLDYTRQDLGGGVGTNLPGDINAALDLSRTVQLANFADTNTTRRNLISRNAALVSVDVPVATDWRVLVGGGPSRLRNSNGLDQNADLNVTDLNAGLRYQSALGNRVDFLLRRDKAKYVIQQTGPFAQSDYHDTTAEVRATWTLSGASRIDGRIGYVKRKNDQRPDLDFSGPAYDVTYTWTPTVLSTVQFYALRERGAAGDALLQTAKSTVYRLTPSLLVGTRIKLRGLLESASRSYYGDPTLNLNRKDTVRAYGFGAGWTPERWLQLDLDFRHEQRSSPLAGFDYTANVGRLQGQARF